ncbi:MAG: response regulator [Candidatus Pacebacteria bacterium]|nr:response regulator [Candidatus Paceibacterota bacterium]
MNEQKHILMVEDDDFLRGLAVTKLQASGMKVDTAPDGEAAITYLTTQAPDLILLDLMLPNMSGFEVLEKVRKMENQKNTKVIIFSNLGDEADILKGQQLGADDYLVKASFTLDELVEKINGMITA